MASTSWTQGQAKARLVVGNQPRELSLLTGNDSAPLVTGPCRFVSRVDRDWVNVARPAHIALSYGTGHGQRISRVLAPGESCPVFPLDLRAALVLQRSERADADFATLLGASVTDEDLIVSAGVEPASTQPSRWIVETLHSPGVAATGITSCRVPVGARRWRPVVPYGSRWLTVGVPWLSYPETNRHLVWSYGEWLAALAGKWLELPSGGGTNVILGGGLLPAPGAVTVSDLLTMRWECEA